MSSKPYLQALAKLRESKNLDTLVAGTNQKYLREGTHDVVIQAVDCNDVSNDRITVVYADKEGKIHTERMFLLSKNKEDISAGIRQLLAAVIPDLGAIDKFVGEQVENRNQRAYEMLTGMELKITLAPGPGFQVRTVTGGKYACYDVETNECLTTEYDSVQEARDAGKATGKYPSFLRITKAEATNVAKNIEFLNNAIEARKKVLGIHSQAFGTGTGPVMVQV